jgi:low affinity Fe/Cu permease
VPNRSRPSQFFMSRDPKVVLANKPSFRSGRIDHRTAQLPRASRVLYRLEHYSSLSSVAIIIVVAIVFLVAVGASLGFPSRWVAGFEVSASAITLAMVFAIQHTQGREQTATQRKLDELLRAIPGAADALMMLEEAPKEFMEDVEESQRDVRSQLVDSESL